ncbi:F-box domain containing protein [Heracleum sosnowskyi]|uniref:F-box domain containing protein n=1 Tax=Heracleum sosnowskyi TaxID=360622 RepID=A0AAD8LZ30_9APIA|nr:F-box domain containing protein [Heracleum sosnowskyi]
MASEVTSSNIFSENTKITDLHPEIIFTHILPRIDHSSLGSLALASKQVHALCNHESIWTSICNSKWQSTKHLFLQNAISSFPGGHRSFFYDSYPILEFGNKCSWYNGHDTTLLQRPELLISAVDIQYKNKNIYSKVDVINTSTKSFASSSFKVEALNLKEFVRLPVKCEEEEDIHLSALKENLKLSWISIDPTQKRAANISSQLPVTVRPHWIDGDIEVKYVIVMPGDSSAGMSSELVEIRIIVMLEWGEEKTHLKLRNVSLQVHDMEGICLQGGESLRILQKAIQCGTRKKARRDEVIDRYKSFVIKKGERREGRQEGQHKIVALLLAIFLVALIVHLYQCF